MIQLTKSIQLLNYDIDVNGVITDKNGIIQKISIHHDNRPYFKNYPIHRIIMYTYYGYKEGYDIHHIDENLLNNKLDNLVYLTRSEHMKIHAKDRTWSEEIKHKMSDSRKGVNNSMYGKHHSIQTKRKLSEARKAYLRNKSK